MNVTQNGLDEWLNATTIEESANTTIIDGIVSLEGDVAATILDLIFDSIKNSTEANNGTGWEVAPPIWEQNEVEETQETEGGENANSNDEGTTANTSGEPLDEDEPVKWEVD